MGHRRQRRRGEGGDEDKSQQACELGHGYY
jgi:hypothetical protein